MTYIELILWRSVVRQTTTQYVTTFLSLVKNIAGIISMWVHSSAHNRKNILKL